MKEYIPFIVFAGIIAVFTIAFIIIRNTSSDDENTTTNNEENTDGGESGNG